MKIVNFNSFMEFANESTTMYKFYRVLNGRIQCYMAARDGIWIYSDTDANQKTIMGITAKGFVETELSKEEIELMRLK